LPCRRVVGAQAALATRLDARHTPLGAGGDLGRGRRVLHDAEQVRGGAAAQQRAPATRQDRCQVARLDARRSMADAIDAAVLAEQGAAADALFELVDREAHAQELRTGHHSMVAVAQSGSVRGG
jgi:hypothetical protein